MFHAPGSLLPSLLLAMLIMGALGHPTTPEQPKRLRLPLKARDTMVNMVKRDRLARRNAGTADFSKRQDPPVNPPGINLPPLTNILNGFTAQVGFGSPPTEYTLLLDLMHPTTWIGAHNTYVRTSTSLNSGKRVTVKVAQGQFTGIRYTDTVTLGPSTAVTAQAIAVASSTFNFYGLDGTLGLAPAQGYNATPGTPTVMDNLYSQGLITEKIFGIQFFPPSSPDGFGTGELTVGGVDTSQWTFPEYPPLTAGSLGMAAPWDTAWAVIVSTYYQSDTTSTLIGIWREAYLDITSPYITMPTDVYNQYVTLTGAVYDHGTGMLKILQSAFPNLQYLTFAWGGAGQTVALTPDAQIWPVWLNTDIGGDPEHFYIPIVDGGSGETTVLGLPFLNRFYLEYNLEEGVAGIAITSFTYMVVNSVIPS